jgi:hypothetical protein
MANRRDAIIAQARRREELWRLEQRQETGDDVEVGAMLEEYNCPICYEVMGRPDRRPMTLFPCGHSVCEQCLGEYIRQTGRNKCCLCNTAFQSQAVNSALLQLIEGAAHTKVEPDYAQSLKLAQARLALLIEQMKSFQLRSKTVKSSLDTEMRVMAVLDDELKFVQEQHRQQTVKVSSLKSENVSIDAELKKLQSLIEPLITEVTKLKLLAEGSQRPA